MQNIEDTEEIVQDTAMKVLEILMDNPSKSKFRKEASLKTWTYTIAINKARDYLRYKNSQKRKAKVVSLSQDHKENKPDIEPANFIHPGLELERKEEVQILWKGINSLPEKQKEAIVLAKFDQNSLKDVAEMMDTTPKAVESLLSRAKANLKIFLLNNKED